MKIRQLYSHLIGEYGVMMALLFYIIFSMSECESLCNRIGIMINGEFRVIGPTEELRSK